MKRILAFLLMIIVLSGMCVFSVSAVPDAEELGGFTNSGYTKYTATTDEGIMYYLKSDGTAAVCGATEGRTELVIPAEVDGYTVSEVRTYNQRFPGCSTVEKLVISDGIQILKGFIHGFVNVTDIYFPSTLNYIEFDFINYTAYYKNPDNWDNGCLYIGTNLVSVNADAPEVLEIREDTTCIAKNLYKPYVGSVKEVILPEFEVHGLKNLIPGTTLERVTVPAWYKTVPDKLFYGCSNLTDVTLEEGITAIGQYSFFRCSSLKEIEFPESLTIIGKSSFALCESFEKMIIPDTITEIHEDAFAGCKSLTYAEVPSSVKVIGEKALGFGKQSWSENTEDGLWYSSTDYFIMCGDTGSAAEAYARENEFEFYSSPDEYQASVDEVDYNNPHDLDEFIFGDVDLDGRVSIKDATYIQKVTAKIIELEYKVQYYVASVNIDFDINIKDATLIRKFIADIEVEYPIGETFTWNELFMML